MHKDNPLKLEVQNLIRAGRSARAGEPIKLAEADDLRSLAVALEIERMIHEGRSAADLPDDLLWSARSV